MSAMVSASLLIGCQEEEEAAVKTISQETVKTLLDFNDGILPSSATTSDVITNFVGSVDNKSLAIDFVPSQGNSEIKFNAATPWDWSNLGEVELAVDIENPGEISTNIFFEVTDADGKKQTRNAHIPAGFKGTFYAPLTGPEVTEDAGIRSNPEPYETDDTLIIWRFGNRDADISKIASISISTKGNIHKRNLIIDNLVVRKSPALKDGYFEKLVDRYGQSAQKEFARKIKSDAQLMDVAAKELANLQASDGMSDRSRFGGWKDGPKLEATGYFRTEKVDGKWWMVDPEGYLFFSNGIANIRMANTTTVTGIDYKDDNIRYVDPNDVTPQDSKDLQPAPAETMETAYVSSDLRRNMFEWLPSYDDDLAAHYHYRKTIFMGPLDHGETFSFYQANLERRYGEATPKSYLQTWREVTLDRMKDWGFTSFGNWVADELYTNEEIPYFANGWIIGDYKTLSSGNDYWGPMPDVFDPEFEIRTKATIDVIAEEVKATPWCIGVFLDNEKSWGTKGTPEGEYGIILDALSKLASDSPAKAKFSELLKEKHGTIDTLNAVWGTDIENWAAFDAGIEITKVSDGMLPDFSFLFETFSEKYFQTVHDTLEDALPNHLYMGVRMASWSMPKDAVAAAIKYTDVMSFNVYKEGLLEESWSFLEDLDKPTLVGEFHMGSQDGNGLLHPGLLNATTQADRGRMYKDYLKTVLDNPYLVGAHWFQYIDSPLAGRAYDGENYNVGFVSVTDQPYPEMVAAAKEVNSTLYPYRFGKTDD